LYLYLPGNSGIMFHTKQHSLPLITLADTFTINSRFILRNIKWRGCSLGISYGLHCPGYEARWGKQIFRLYQERPTRLLFNRSPRYSHIHLLPRLMSEAIEQLPLYVLTVLTGKLLILKCAIPVVCSN